MTDHGAPSTPDLTWPALLAHWTSFAQASVALPKDDVGDRWRAAVAPIINLQAVTFALADLEKLTLPGERALALDKSELIVRGSTGTLHTLWRSEPLPQELVAMIHDANVALAAARSSGIEWRVSDDVLLVGHPGELVDRLLQLEFSGDLYVPTPGVPLFRTSPAAFAREADGSRPNDHVIRAIKEFLVDVGKPEPVAGFRQVYRQFDFAKGGPVRDLVVTFDQLPAGQPLLVPAIENGKPVSVTLPPRKGGDFDLLPVVFQGPLDD
ncbi:MAG: hypothetical protein K2W85_13765 [Phycisphaerales bacterium]|nr:hypothetical protein [Phycisphaerales bacterium]